MRPMLLATILLLLCSIGLGAQQQRTAPKAVAQPEVFLAIGGDVDAVGHDGATPLLRAAAADDLTRVTQLIRGGANVNAGNRYGVTPLSLAASNGNAGMVDALLTAGADAKTIIGEGETVLMRAARSGNVKIVERLLRAGADPNAREKWLGQTALMWAAAENQAAVVQTLLAHGADLHAATDLLEYHKLLPTDGMSGKMPLPRGGNTALHFAARAGALDAVKVLAAAPGANLNEIDPDGIMPLLYATLNQHYDTAAYLLERGADPNQADDYGRTVLHAAIDRNRPEWISTPPVERGDRTRPLDLAKLALAKGADPNAVLSDNPPMRCANGCPDTYVWGATALWRAAKGSDPAAIKLLLAAGADPVTATRDADGVNPLILAAGSGWRDNKTIGTEAESIESIKLLMAAGVDINAATPDGETALHGAAHRGAETVIKFLVENGADLAAKDKKGRAPLDIALRRAVVDGPIAAGSDEATKGTMAAANLLRELMTARGIAVNAPSQPGAALPTPSR